MLTRTRWLIALALVSSGSPGFAQNLHSNPDFDDSLGTAGWTVTLGTLEHNDEDSGGCSGSGHLRVIGQDQNPFPTSLNARGPCVPITETGELFLKFDYYGFGVVPGTANILLRSYQGPGCTGNQLAVVGPEVLEAFPWEQFEDSFFVVAGGSVRFHLDGGTSAAIDGILLTRQPAIFLDDFETGGFCGWSSTNP